MKSKLLFVIAALVLVSPLSIAQPRSRNTPDSLVRNLYAAHKSRRTDPFFQTKKRASLEKYFTKELADLIWKDAETSAARNEVGALDGDPLYNAQDMKITGLRIKPPTYGEGNLDLADVPVTFKNFGKEQTILFRLSRNKGIWRISDIFYPANDASAASLKKMLSSQ